jgi:uncharacterized protein (TIGR02996 family)
MHDEAAILEYLRSHSDDKIAYLAYADWLQEHQRWDEAEFIRVEIELSAETLPNRRKNELKRLQRQLFEYLYPNQERGLGFGTSWGLPSSISWEASKHPFEAFQEVVLRHPTIRGYSVNSLSYQAKLSGPEVVDQFFNHPNLDATTPLGLILKAADSLSLSNIDWQPSWSDQVVDGNLFPNLSWLGLRGEYRTMLEASSIQRLGEATFQQTLTRFDFSNFRLDRIGYAALADWPCCARLESLDLSWIELSDQGLERLLRNPWPVLKSLNLGRNSVSDDGLLQLVKHSFPKLEEFCSFTLSERPEEVIIALLHAPWVKNLESWSHRGALSWNMLEAYRNAFQEGKLESLWFDGYPEFDDSHLQYLLNSAFTSKLQGLSISNNRLTDDALDKLSEHPMMETIEHLDLEEGDFQLDTFFRLVQSERAGKLQSFTLPKLPIPEVELMTFLESNWEHIHCRYLSAPYLKFGHPDDRIPLSDRFFEWLFINLDRLDPTLEDLYLCGHFSDDAVADLPNFETFRTRGIRVLLTSPLITNAGLARFLQNPGVQYWVGNIDCASWRNLEAHQLISSCPYLNDERKEWMIRWHRIR